MRAGGRGGRPDDARGKTLDRRTREGSIGAAIELGQVASRSSPIASAFSDRIQFGIGSGANPGQPLFLTGGKKSDWEGLAQKYLRDLDPSG